MANASLSLKLGGKEKEDKDKEKSKPRMSESNHAIRHLSSESHSTFQTPPKITVLRRGRSKTPERIVHQQW